MLNKKALSKCFTIYVGIHKLLCKTINFVAMNFEAKQKLKSPKVDTIWLLGPVKQYRLFYIDIMPGN
jgi:hypothetical protein